MNLKDIAKKYPEAAAFAGVAASVWNGSNSPAKVEMQVTGKLHAELENLLNKSIQTVFITDSDMRHIKKYHSKNEDARGQVNLTPRDFALIPLVLNEYDSIEMTDVDKLGNKRFLLSKVIENETYITTIQRGKKKMEVCSFWIKRMSGASC